MNEFDLEKMFGDWNQEGFEGELSIPKIRWNPRLRTSAGRFIPDPSGCVIEVASYLRDELDAEKLIRDTLGHEMIHYWLFVKNLPYGHTSLFHQKMEQIGVSRYNPVPKHRPFKHCYECRGCGQRIFVRKRLRLAACAACCNLHADGCYDPRFKLKLLASGDAAFREENPMKRSG
ncbi:MAG: SprT-like domain-containing protein [Bdellovibrionales bacterium]|nr:SprT-like domain-containing protein [Bdellovibrionales bacterium]